MRIEWVSPDMERIVPRDEEMEELGSGYNGAEGPVWWKESGHLLFSDIANDRRMKWAPGEGVSVFLEPANKANGLTRDPHGRLIACEQATRRVTRLEPDGNITVVVDGYQGKRLNCPNDVVVRSDGTIYFSDPGIGWIPSPELDFAGVYRVSPDLSTATVVVRDLVVPNGLAFSPDESILYIVDSRPGHIRAFAVQADGTLANDRLFFSGFSRDRRSVPDGIKVDVEGNLYCACAGLGGVWVIDAAGRHLGTFWTGEDQRTSNCAWGGEDWKTLFITTKNTLCRIQLKIAGVPVSPGQ